MRFILDTNILIDQLRGGNKWNEFVENIDKDSEIFIPTIVVFELFLGLSSKKPEIAKKINNIRLYLQPVDLTWEIAKRAGEIYRDKKKEIEAPDCIIAATAMEIGAQVVTLNKKHFSRIPNLMIYSFEY